MVMILSRLHSAGIMNVVCGIWIQIIQDSIMIYSQISVIRMSFIENNGLFEDDGQS